MFDCIHMNMIQMQLTLPALFAALLRLFCFGTRNCGRHVYAYSPPPLVQLTHNSKENASIPYETIVMTALAVNHYLNLQ